MRVPCKDFDDIHNISYPTNGHKDVTTGGGPQDGLPPSADVKPGPPTGGPGSPADKAPADLHSLPHADPPVRAWSRIYRADMRAVLELATPAACKVLMHLIANLDPNNRVHVGLKSTARRLGVSHSTVSRALRELEQISVSGRRPIVEKIVRTGLGTIYGVDPELAAYSGQAETMAEFRRRASAAAFAGGTSPLTTCAKAADMLSTTGGQPVDKSSAGVILAQTIDRMCSLVEHLEHRLGLQ